VFIRSVREGRRVLLREPYNVVEYDTDPNRQVYVEGLADPGLDLITGRSTKVGAEEVYDDIRVYDSPPFLPNVRIGSAV